MVAAERKQSDTVKLRILQKKGNKRQINVRSHQLEESPTTRLHTASPAEEHLPQRAQTSACQQ